LFRSTRPVAAGRQTGNDLFWFASGRHIPFLVRETDNAARIRDIDPTRSVGRIEGNAVRLVETARENALFGYGTAFIQPVDEKAVGPAVSHEQIAIGRHPYDARTAQTRSDPVSGEAFRKERSSILRCRHPVGAIGYGFGGRRLWQVLGQD